MREVTDPDILQQLESAPSLKPVEDPDILAQLEGTAPKAGLSTGIESLAAEGAVTLGAMMALPEKAAEIGGKALDDTVRMIASGASFNWADEAAAGINALLGIGEGATIGERYDNNLKAEMAQDAQIRQEKPASSFAAEMGGGLTTALPGAQAVMGIKNVPTIAKTVGLGATGGTIAGAGASDPGSRGKGALTGGLIGGALGGAIPLAKDAVTATIQRFSGTTSNRATRTAATKILQALQRDELTPDEAFRRVQELGPEARLIDVGDNTRSLGRAVAGLPGKPKAQATEFLNTRQEGQGKRVMDAVNKALDPAGDFAGAMDDLQAIRRADAKPLYDAAYAKPIEPNKALKDLFSRPALEKAWRKATEIARNEGDEIPALFVKGQGGEKIINPEAISDVKTLDYIKRGLDDLVEPHRDMLSGKITTNAGRGIDNLRKDLLAVVDRLSPDYKAARAAWSGPTHSMSMMEQGRRFIKGDEDVLARQVANMTDDEKLFFRTGVTRALRDAIYNAPDGADTVKRLFGSEMKRARLRQVFPDQDSFDSFRKTMEQESELYTTRAIVSPRSGSQTELRQEGTADLVENVGEGISEMAKGNTGSAAHRFLRGLFGKSVDKIPPEQSEAIAKMLFTNDAETNRQIVRALSVQRLLEGANVGAGVASVEASRQAATAVNR